MVRAKRDDDQGATQGVAIDSADRIKAVFEYVYQPTYIDLWVKTLEETDAFSTILEALRQPILGQSPEPDDNPTNPANWLEEAVKPLQEIYSGAGDTEDEFRARLEKLNLESYDPNIISWRYVRALLTQPHGHRSFVEHIVPNIAIVVMGEVDLAFKDLKGDEPPPSIIQTTLEVLRRPGFLARALVWSACEWAKWLPSAQTSEVYDETIASLKPLWERLEETARLWLSPPGGGTTTPAPPRRSNRKIIPPTFPNGLLPVPNILNHGTRYLGQMLAGAAEWASDPDNRAMLATINGRTVGMIELGDGGEDEAGRIIDALGPRSLKATIAIAAVIYHKSGGRIVNQVATLSVGEIARAMGYKPNSITRAVDTKTLLRVANDLRPPRRILTWAADGAWDTKANRANSAWVTPFLWITAVHVQQLGLDGDPIPIEFDAMLGRNWAEAIQDRFDVLQVAPGFMELDPQLEEQVIRLAWYYLTDFRYRMRRGPRKDPQRIETLCAAARLDTGQPKHRGRFLDRLEAWHARLLKLGILGSYERIPEPGANWPPSQIFTEGTYRATPPEPILEAYKKKPDLTISAKARGGKC